jgi:hypothetical protein
MILFPKQIREKTYDKSEKVADAIISGTGFDEDSLDDPLMYGALKRAGRRRECQNTAFKGIRLHTLFLSRYIRRYIPEPGIVPGYPGGKR